MKVGYLDKRESAEIINRLKTSKWGSVLMEIKRKENILRIEIGDILFYKISKFLFCGKSDLIFPTLLEEYNQEILTLLPAMIVDMGAVPHIIRGADVMRPGVKGFEGVFKKGDLVVVKDEKNLRAIALTLALEDLEKCEGMVKGRIAENIHHVDDEIWNLVKKIKHLLK